MKLPTHKIRLLWGIISGDLMEGVAMSDSEIDYLETQIPELAQAAVTIAYWQALAAGHSVLEAHDGVIYEIFPDGGRRFVKQIEPPTPVEKGTKIHIR
jgi:hypothetical protein